MILSGIKIHEIQGTYIFNHLSLFINSFQEGHWWHQLLRDTTCFTILYMCVDGAGMRADSKSNFKMHKEAKAVRKQQHI